MEITMEMSDFIKENTVFHLDKADRSGVLDELIAQSLTLGKITDPQEFRKAVLEREALMSTGIGLGVAIPHAKLSCISDFFIITGILKNPVEWDAIDHRPVSIVFLIGGPEDSQGAYLQILARIITLIKQDEKLAMLNAAQTAADINALFSTP
jgi:PTS system nitrogen regulatory IIA component